MECGFVPPRSLTGLSIAKILFEVSSETFYEGLSFMRAAGLAPDRISIICTKEGRYFLHSQCMLFEGRPFDVCRTTFESILRYMVYVCARKLRSVEFINIAFHAADIAELKQSIETLEVEMVILRNCTYPGIANRIEANELLRALSRGHEAIAAEYGDERLMSRIRHEEQAAAELGVPAQVAQQNRNGRYRFHVVRSLVSLSMRKILKRTTGQVFTQGIDCIRDLRFAPERVSVMATQGGKYILQIISCSAIRPYTVYFKSFSQILNYLIEIRAWKLRSIEFVNVPFNSADIPLLKRSIEENEVQHVVLCNCTYPGVTSLWDAVHLMNAINKRNRLYEIGDNDFFLLLLHAYEEGARHAAHLQLLQQNQHSADVVAALPNRGAGAHGQ